MHENDYLETYTFHKERKTHDYLNYNSYRSNHVKYNIPFNLAKYILIFISDEQKVTLQLKELQKWLLNCSYPESVIDKSFFNAKLQGPTNKPANSKNILPLLSTYYSHYDMQNIVNTINQKLKQSPNELIKEDFGEKQTVFPLKQPPNVLNNFSKKNKNKKKKNKSKKKNNKKKKKSKKKNNKKQKKNKNDGYFNVCFIVIIKTVSYVHYILNHTPVSRLQITLLDILGVR